MSAEAPIINRFLRLRKEVLDPLQPGLTFEGLVDAFIVLYENCKDETKGKQHLVEFINKFQTTVNNYNKLRISINDFDVKRIIGRGNFADVKLAKEKSSGNVYAMKIMKKTGDRNSAFYEEERDIMARSTSSWLTKLDYAFQDDLHLYLAMEFHAGGDLLSLLDKTGHKLEEPAVRFYTAEVALGIHDLHKMGYVHRDIKPENILLDITGHVKIADFGSSARLNTAGLVTKVIPVGTPEYIAPEVLQCLQSKTGSKSHGAECDYWSLGILAYEMMFGETPFSDLDGSVINTYSNIMAHKQVEFPSNEECSGELKSLIKRLLSSAPKRIGHQNLIRHPFFGDIDWNNMRNQKPPHVPQVKRADDTSNFDVIEDEPSSIDISSLTDKKTLKHLPFIGFTFTSDKGKLKSLETKESTSLETELKTKASELENYKLRIFQLEQQIFSTTRTHETSQRDFEATEKLTYELSMAENENTQLKTNIKNLERVLEIERQERSATEHKTLQVLQDVRNKWAKKEEEKLDKLRTELKEEQDKSSELETTLSSTRRELKATKSELESVKGIKTQLKNKLKDYKQRLENVAALEEKRSEKLSILGPGLASIQDIATTLKQLEHENSKLKEVVSETTSALNESRSIEGKVDALQLIIEQRDQILAEKNAEIKIKSAEVESFAALHTADKKTIQDLESKFRSAQVDLKKLQRDIDNLHMDKSETEEVNTTVVQMRTELTEAISEIATLRDQVESGKANEQTLTKEIGKLNLVLEKKDLDKDKVVNRLKKEFQEKEEDWKNKIKELEKVFETLQAKIDDLQKKRREEVKEKGRKEVLELEEKLEKLEDLVEEKKREEDRLKEVVRKQEKENTELKGKVKDCEVVIVEIEQKKVELEKTIQEEKEAEAESTELLEKVMILEKELREVKLDLRIEKRETEKKSGIVKYYREKEDKSKEKITELETRISELEKELGDIKAEKDRLDLEVKGLERSNEKMEKMKEDLEKIKQQKLEISMEKRRLETEVSGYERRIERLEKEIQGFSEEKEKFKSIQINNDALKGLCEDLDRQVTEFESAAESLEDRVQVLEAEKRELISKVDLVQEDSRKVKIAVNEEKSVKLFTEKKLKTMEQKLEDYEKQANKEKEVYEKNLSEYKELCKKLSGALEELTGKNMKMEQTGNSLEKLKSSLEYENSQLKIELGEKTTQLHSHKESNFKLTNGIEEAIKKIEQKNQQIDEIHLKIETDSRIMSELVTRHEATIAQQTKLIDFLQQKVGELEGRKKTLADKIFGNKEN
ncbi:citron Rho-interacting kinase, partial [Eurytemora carolleeae]|uniref:citron Rho-interacting kinase n=1 Tax=Eurytemora carolleeae TaxID=1294199 RepID=UPI000C76150E